jgi:uncharacterized membrane protein
MTTAVARAGPNTTERLARGLGWFSVGLGLAELTAPGTVARLIGVKGRNTRGQLRAIGLREIASGVGILSRPHPAGWLWARVGGDIMDLTLLGKAHRSSGVNRNRVAAATLAVAGVTLLDFLAGERLSEESAGNGAKSKEIGRIHIVKAVTINRPPQEIYSFWRNFENLPRFMEHLEEVQVIDEKRSHWKAKAPVGTSVEWDAEIVQDQPGELIAWRSLPSAQIPNEGVVRFTAAPGGQGTEVRVELRYEPPGGLLGAAVARLLGEEPDRQVAADLRRLKQVLETGEVVYSDASIHRGSHPARPSAESKAPLPSRPLASQSRGGRP